jgi:hypothetical protein
VGAPGQGHGLRNTPCGSTHAGSTQAMLDNIAFISNHKVWSIHVCVQSRAALRSRQEMAGELLALVEGWKLCHESDFGAAEYPVVLSCFYEKSIQILK